MLKNTHEFEKKLYQYFESQNDVAVAVSGGIDSLTLMAFAHKALGERAVAMHAYSPAVPDAASKRVRQLSKKYNWKLKVFDAGEFADVNYLQNPVNRCYFCKSNLYFSISTILHARKSNVVSGANLDDLSDYRPGLNAALEHKISHPYIELGIDKNMVRSLSKLVGLSDLSSLPSSPCLASRVRTGIVIEPKFLKLIDEVESAVGSKLRCRSIRFRVELDYFKLEIDHKTLVSLTDNIKYSIIKEVKQILYSQGFTEQKIIWAPYERGSSFSTGKVSE